jgi:hypothetical protein
MIKAVSFQYLLAFNMFSVWEIKKYLFLYVIFDMMVIRATESPKHKSNFIKGNKNENVKV